MILDIYLQLALVEIIPLGNVVPVVIGKIPNAPANPDLKWGGK